MFTFHNLNWIVFGIYQNYFKVKVTYCIHTNLFITSEALADICICFKHSFQLSGNVQPVNNLDNWELSIIVIAIYLVIRQVFRTKEVLLSIFLLTWRNLRRTSDWHVHSHLGVHEREICWYGEKFQACHLVPEKSHHYLHTNIDLY